MLAVIVVAAALALALAVASVALLWRAYGLIHELESIVADEDDRVRALELQLLRSRRIA